MSLTTPALSQYADPATTVLVAGFGRPLRKKAHKRHRNAVGAFFVPAVRCYGGCARDALGRAGFLFPRSTNLRTVTTLTCLVASRGDSKTEKGVSPMSNTARGASAPSPQCPRSIATAHRRMAIAALRANSSVSVRLARYNAHMVKARALEGGAA